MIIDTTKLFNAIDANEEKLLKIRHSGNRGKYLLSFLTASEKRVLQGRKLISDIENLMNKMIKNGCYKDNHTVLADGIFVDGD